MQKLINSLKQEEYTGENRCKPCTVLNVVIAGVIGAAVAQKSRISAALVLGLSVGLIYFRGYLIPGTPTMTKRYLPPVVLNWFGKKQTVDTASGFGKPNEDSIQTGRGSHETDSTNPTGFAEDSKNIDMESYFIECQILEVCADETDLCPTPEFHNRWNDTVTRLDSKDIGTEAIVEAYDLDSNAEYDIEMKDKKLLLNRDGRVKGQWPSKSALIADIFASEVLTEMDPEWGSRNAEEKGFILNGLRLFLPTCPDGDSVTLTHDVVESCCTSRKVVAAVCENSDERLFEKPVN
ncbi:hypothetical protein EGH22_20630 [Halomicroarcula sp. F28]|uniref:hypothetical protein n=1 Tax=Haloarcula salinisoli TaxID=2487746 RepID=UPI001C73D96C|nr:hypothetical protein [Halomicroarcula salinisoli]MBX0288740.1 hypothetical protein [Halomicroarcula salinisoli]